MTQHKHYAVFPAVKDQDHFFFFFKGYNHFNLCIAKQQVHSLYYGPYTQAKYRVVSTLDSIDIRTMYTAASLPSVEGA